jgi:hypothetical protein
MLNPAALRYPLLEEILMMKGRSLQPTYSNRDVADIFNVSIRAIQARIKAGRLSARELPGKARFLSVDLETFLVNSAKTSRRA